MSFLRHLFSQFNFMFGGIWALVGTPFLCVGVMMALQADWKLAAIFGLAGGVFGGVGWVLVVRSILKTRRLFSLLRHGDVAVGRVLEIRRDMSVTMNGRHPVFLKYAFEAPNGRGYGGDSDYLPRELETRWKAGADVAIVFDFKDPSRHVADIYGTRSSIGPSVTVTAALLCVCAAAAGAIDPLEPLKRILVPRPVFMELCRGAYHSTWQRVLGRGRLVPLTPRQREKLAAFYGPELLDRAEFRYNATIPGIRILGLTVARGASAMTIGRHIHLKNEPRPDSNAQLILLAHELRHTLQYDKGHFGQRYCEGLYDSDFSYEHNRMEVEAFAAEESFRVFLETGALVEIDPNKAMRWREQREQGGGKSSSGAPPPKGPQPAPPTTKPPPTNKPG